MERDVLERCGGVALLLSDAERVPVLYDDDLPDDAPKASRATATRPQRGRSRDGRIAVVRIRGAKSSGIRYTFLNARVLNSSHSLLYVKIYLYLCVLVQ